MKRFSILGRTFRGAPEALEGMNRAREGTDLRDLSPENLSS